MDMAHSAIKMSRINLLVVVGLLVAFASPADAVTYAKFYKGIAPGSVYSGPYSGAGTVYDATKSLATDCPTTPSGCGTGDRLSDPMIWSGLGITATAPGTNNVWNDLTPNFGGLGAGLTSQGSDADQIEGTDVLKISFSSLVKLTGVGTLFDGSHTPFGTGFSSVASVAAVAATIQFQMAVCVSGVCSSYNPVSFALANAIGLSLIGDTFKFMQLTGNPSFYVSALAYESCGPTGAGCAPPPPVPIPGALPLFATGLIGLAWLGRRRKRKSTATRAA